MSLARRRVRGMLTKWLDCSGGEWVRADRSKLAAALSLSVRTVQRALNDLREDEYLPDGWTFRSCNRRGRGREVLVCAQPWALPGAEPLDWDGERWRGHRRSFRPGVGGTNAGPSDSNKGLTPRRLPARRGATGAAGAVAVRNALQNSEHGRRLRRSVRRTLERRGARLWRSGVWRGDIAKLTYIVARETRVAVADGHCRKPEAYAAKLWDSRAENAVHDWERTWQLHEQEWRDAVDRRRAFEAEHGEQPFPLQLPAGLTERLELDSSLN